MKKVFLEDLPRWKEGRHKGKINWKESIGYKVRFIYDDIEGWIEIIDYIKQGRILYVRYKNKEPFKIKTINFQRHWIGTLIGEVTSEFKIEIGTIFKDDKRDFIINSSEIRRDKNNKTYKYYKYTCNKCGWDEGRILESNLLKGVGCPVCGIPPKIVVEGINDIPTIAPWMIQYFQGGYDEAKLYTKSSNKKIKPICPDCGRVKDGSMMINTIYENKSIRCTCGDNQPYPEKFMNSVLQQLGIKFKPQLTKTTFKWCKDYRYDFYFELNNDNYIVETHGSQHYEQQKRKGARSLQEEIKNDGIKKELALQNGIREENYIVINCKYSDMEWIKNDILKSRLNELFDLSNINWNKCEEFALKNLVKVACDYKNNDPNITTVEIGKIMKLDRGTIVSYLKKGTKLGWCKYDPKEEQRKVGNKNRKQVEIFKDGISLGVFESAAELERQSEELFGVRLDNGTISKVCNGKCKPHKEFTFKFVNIPIN